MMKKFFIIFLSVFSFLLLTACDEEDLTTDEDLDLNLPENTEYKDGRYELVGEPWQYGYESVEVLIEDGRITDVVLRRFSNPKEGEEEGTEINYDEWVGGDAPGSRPNLKEYRRQLSQEIITKQSADNVDAISGATITTENWIELVKQVLDQARNENDGTNGTNGENDTTGTDTKGE
jgi:major membrane immunogen (membrane-anchored lipoprotein)